MMNYTYFCLMYIESLSNPLTILCISNLLPTNSFKNVLISPSLLAFLIEESNKILFNKFTSCT